MESGLLFRKRCYALCQCIDHIKSYTCCLPLQTYADNQQVRQIWAIQCYLLLGGALSCETCFMELVVFLTFGLTSQHSCQALNLIPATYRKPKFVPSCGLWCCDESFGRTVPVLLSQLSQPLTTAVDGKTSDLVFRCLRNTCPGSTTLDNIHLSHGHCIYIY